MDLAPAHVEVDMIERQRAGELLDDALDLEKPILPHRGTAGFRHWAMPQIFRYCAL